MTAITADRYTECTVKGVLACDVIVMRFYFRDRYLVNVYINNTLNYISKCNFYEQVLSMHVHEANITSRLYLYNPPTTLHILLLPFKKCCAIPELKFDYI